jgi:ProP effector
MTSTTETAAATATPPGIQAPKPHARRGRNNKPQQARKADPGADSNANPNPKATAQRAPRKVHPVLERLFELYPKMFGPRFLPLKLGVYQDLLALHPEEFKKEDLKVALGLHARSTRYLEAVAAGEKRHDLNGLPIEDVSPEHVHHAILEVFKRRQARTPEDLRPKLRARLVEAIEASGLGREDYMLIVRTQDETANAALDEAFAEVGARVAKREALQRAFEASGRSVAEFAEMYGLDASEVGRTLRQGR